MTHAAEWVLLAAGMGGFVVCMISDFLGLCRKKKLAVALFFAGTVIILSATVVALVAYADVPAAFKNAPVFSGCAAAGSLFFFGLTVYSLTSVPKENYQTTTGTLTDTGLYALCRHPGVCCLAGAYLFMGLMAGSPFIWAIGAANVAMDLIYVAIQDIYIFPKTIGQYDRYKARVPFLIPNRKSIKRACCRERSSLGGADI